MYRSLNPQKVIETLGQLKVRIVERFPDSGLGKVCGELESIAEDTLHRITWISKPQIFIRIGVGLVIFLILGLLVFTITTINLKDESFGIAELVQVLEAAINDIVLIGAAIFFLTSVEGRIKRMRALKVLHELRSIVHVIDMHQLTKDPNRNPAMNTEHSPKTDLSRIQLGRYLDYCTEMLSITGKVAALYAQAIEDAVILQTVNDIEDLTTSMSQKIWQKIMMLRQFPDEYDEDDELNANTES